MTSAIYKRNKIVSKFLVIHPVGGDMTLESGTPIAKSIKAHLTSDAYWRRSYYAPDAGANIALGMQQTARQFNKF